jgi:hypothetical protein
MRPGISELVPLVKLPIVNGLARHAHPPRHFRGSITIRQQLKRLRAPHRQLFGCAFGSHEPGMPVSGYSFKSQ